MQAGSWVSSRETRCRVGGDRAEGAWRPTNEAVQTLCHPPARAVAEFAQHREARFAFDERGISSRKGSTLTVGLPTSAS